ncbi:MAG: hypothetical protein RJA52_1449 [Bacteroidota bacterium]
MKVYHTIEELPIFSKTVLTIGSFDGVHLGHKALIDQLLDISKNEDAESILITFHPHPRKILGDKIELLTTLDEKIEILSKLGLDHLAIIPFTESFSELSPLEYVEDFLVKYFHPKAIVIGYDHKFGKNRKGDLKFLESLSEKWQYRVIEIGAEMIDQLNISSSGIRKFLSLGNILEANSLLGYPYSFGGIVVHGNKIGKELGYPTANLKLENEEKKIPCAGIFAIKVKVGTKIYNGMLYLGNRPTIEGETKNVIEVNIFDFSEEIYGESIRVFIIDFIRHDEKFNSLEELKNTIDKDKSVALKLLS